MSLNGNANTDYISIANDSSWGSGQKYSGLIWFYTSDLTNEQYLFGYDWDGQDRFRLAINAASNRLLMGNYCNGDNFVASSSTNSLNLNKWTCVAYTADTSLTLDAIQFFLGELGGALGSDDASNTEHLASAQTYSMGNAFYLANIDTNNATYCRCPIAVHIMLVGKILTQPQFQELMYRPIACMKYSETVMFHLLGLHGVGSLPDLSGTGNTGTPNSMVLSDPVPLGPLFGCNAAYPYAVAVSYSLDGTISGTSSLAGDLASAKTLIGSTTGSGALVGDLESTNSLDGLVVGTSSLAGSLESGESLAGSVSGSSLLSGDILSAESLGGSVGGTSTLIGDLYVLKTLGGLIIGTSSLTGDLTLESATSLAGSILGQSSLTGNLSVGKLLVGDVSGQSLLVGDVLCTANLSGQILGQSLLVGDLQVALPGTSLSGIIYGQSSLSGNLIVTGTLIGTIYGQSTLVADLSTDQPLNLIALAVPISIVVRKFLVDNGLVNMPYGVGGWPCFVSFLPDGSAVFDNAVCVYDGTHEKNARLMLTGENIYHYGFSILLRTRNYLVGWQKMYDLASLLDQSSAFNVSLDESTRVFIGNAARRSGVTALGVEDGTRRRFGFDMSYVATANQYG